MKDGFSRDKEEALLQRFKQNHTWQTPTLVLHRVIEVADPSALASDPRLKYLPANLTTSWLRVKDLVASRPPEQVEFMRWLYGTQKETVAMMSRIGVGLLAGTDVRNPYCLPGFSLHDELALMVDAGLTTDEALRTATINPARLLDGEEDHPNKLRRP